MSSLRRLALAGFIVSALLLVAGSAPGCETPLPEGQARVHTIPFILQHDKVVISTRVNDSREMNVLLDTGMQFEGLLLYKQELEDQVGVDKWNEMGVVGAGSGGAAKAVQAEGRSFTAGDAVFTDQRIVVLQNDSFAGFPRDGVIGYSLFGRHVVEIDHDTMTITLHEPGSVKPGSGWHRIPLTFKGSKIPWLDVAVSIDGEAEATLRAYIDLASREAIELLTFEGQKFELPADLEESYLGRGLSGDIHGQKGKIAYLKLGDFTFRNVTAAFANVKVRSKQPGAEAVLGNNAFRRFNQIFDYAGGSLYLKPNAHFEEPFE